MNANSDDERYVYEHPASLAEYYKTTTLPLEEEELLDFSYPTSTVKHFVVIKNKDARISYLDNRLVLYINRKTMPGLPEDTLDQFLRDIIVIYFNRSLYDIDAYIEFYELLINLHNTYAKARTELENQYSYVTGEDFNIKIFQDFIDDAKKQKLTAMQNNSIDASNANVDEEKGEVTDSDNSDEEEELLRRARARAQAQAQAQVQKPNSPRQSQGGGARRRKPRK